MKRNGFTLVELLGVIIVLSLLVILVFPSIVNSVKNSSTKTDDLTKEMIYKAADLYISNHKGEFIKTNGSQYVIDLKDLVEEEHLSSPIKLSDGKDITNNKCIQVIYNDGYKYELKNIGTCNEKVLICESVNDTENYNVGDEYICEVKPGVKHTFFILSTNKDEEQNITSINLIMDGFVASDGTPIKSNEDIVNLQNTKIEYGSAWISTEDYSGEICDPNSPEIKAAAETENITVPGYCSKHYAKTDKGPITVFEYLRKATSSWEYISNIQMDYTDEGNNYGEIKTEGNKTILKDKSGNIQKTFYNLKARLPKYSEINDLFKGSYELSNLQTNKDEEFIINLPTWINKYIPKYGKSYSTFDECINYNDEVICGLSGFWLLSSVDINVHSDQRLAYDVSTEGFLGKSNTVTSSKYYSTFYTGVRPVITLNKNSLYIK